MNTKLTVKTPLNIPVWQRPADATQRILLQVTKLTRELNAVQTELYRELAEADGSLRQKSLLNSSAATDDLLALKIAADQLRRILWFYLEHSPEQNGTDGLSQATKLENDSARVSLAPQRQPEPQPAEPGSFFERLNLVIDGYMQQRGDANIRKASKP